jgi:hypothetical protein
VPRNGKLIKIWNKSVVAYFRIYPFSFWIETKPSQEIECSAQIHTECLLSARLERSHCTNLLDLAYSSLFVVMETLATHASS